jgi:hypothetical protein
MSEYYENMSNASHNYAYDDDLTQYDMSSTGSSRYSVPINNIFNKHTNDIRNSTNDIITINASAKKKLKDIIGKHNNDVFGFIKSDSTTSSNIETIFKRFGSEATPLYKQGQHFSVSKEYGLDCSLNEVITELNTSYSNAVDASNNLLGFMNGLRWVLTEYRNAGEEVARLDSLINQKLGNLDKIYKKLHILQQLPDNASMPAVYEALEEYAETAFKEANIVENYNELVHLYKKWNILREVMSIQQLFEPKHNESICAICVSDPISHTISPCGHTFCSGCIRKMNTSCYICRGAIRDRIRLYFN